MHFSALASTTGSADRPQGLADLAPYWRAGLGLFLLALLLRLACFTGLIASDDDLLYAGYAQRIAEGLYTLEYHHYAIRYGLILPAGLLYKLVGVNEWSTIAVPLFASSLSVVLLALIATRLFGIRAGLIAALLYATFPIQLRYATVLVPEPIVECYVLLALVIYVWTEDWQPMVMGWLAGVLIGIAYLTKEPALFIAPALLIDAALRRRWRNAIGIALGISAIILLEHAYYVAITGDLLFRPHAMAAHNQRMILPTGEVNYGSLSFRLFKAYPRMMLLPNVDFGLHSLGALIAAAWALLRFRKDRRIYFLLIWAAIPWLYLNFGTSSFSRYIPIPAAPRYIEFAYPPLFLLMAWLLADLTLKANWEKRLLLGLMACVAFVGLICGLSTRATGYRAAHVAVLRVIADKAEKEGISSACFDIPADLRLQSRWQPALAILGRGRLKECDKAQSHIIVRVDKLGFPYVASREPSP